MTTAYISHPDSLRHEMVPGHPECPERVGAIEQSLAAAGILGKLHRFEAWEARLAEIARVHDRAYIEKLFSVAPATGSVRIDPDTSMNPHTMGAALHAAGAVVLATDLVMRGEVRNAFCNVRPPGHHAERARAMGFCFINSIAVGAAHALARHGLQRVAIIDFDVHHGNGTEDIFRDEPQVLMCSTYQYPLYPHVRSPIVDGHMVNVMLAEGTGSDGFRSAVSRHWLPALDAFRPQIVFVSAGFDAHRDDPLAGMELEDEDYAWVSGIVMQVADEHAGGRLVSSLEGGYSLDALARCATVHVRTLAGL